MKKLLVSTCVAGFLFTQLIVLELPTGATHGLSEAFIAKYGSALSAQFGCLICHSRESVEKLNPYGRSFGYAFIPGGACLEFHPPNTHTISRGFCGYLHAEGMETPYSSKCTTCHGADLRGLIAPSCFTCHERRWEEDPPTGQSDEIRGGAAIGFDNALAMIEEIDSDGDGFTNVAEIMALTNPGDAKSFPGKTTEVRVQLEKTWQREWIGSEDNLEVTIAPIGEGLIDTTMHASLKTTAGELVTTKFLREFDNPRRVRAVFPKALLYVLFDDPADKRATIVMSGSAKSGATFTTKIKIRQKGKIPPLLKKVKLRIKPHLWGDDGKVTFTIKGRKADLIDIDRPLLVVGTSGFKLLESVRRSGSTVVGVLSIDDAKRLIGIPLLNGAVHTLAVTGHAQDEEKILNVAATVALEPTECYRFRPPSSHNVSLDIGDCVYLHAPGFETPFASRCNACHGIDLNGTTVTPSCYLCHPRLWSGAAH